MTRRGWHGVAPVGAGDRPTGMDGDGRPPLGGGPRRVRQDVTIAPEVTATVDFELT